MNDYMIDWLTLQVIVPHRTAIHGGIVIRFTEDGVQDWQSLQHLHHKGSFENSIAVKSLDFNDELRYGTRIEISGNPSKFFQGHNLLGSDDILGLSLDLITDIFEKYQLDTYEIKSIRLSRVDITKSFKLNYPEYVGEFIRQAAESATLQFRGRGSLKDQTLYFGKNSRRWSLKIYNKAQEMKAHPPSAQLSPADISRLHGHAIGIVRAEITLRGLELKRRNLHMLDNWTTESPRDTFDDLFGALTFTENAMPWTSEDTLSLPSGIRSTFELWRMGRDLKSLLPLRTFYDHRRKLKNALNIDIAAPPPGGWKTEEPPKDIRPKLELLQTDHSPIADLVYRPKIGRLQACSI